MQFVVQQLRQKEKSADQQKASQGTDLLESRWADLFQKIVAVTEGILSMSCVCLPVWAIGRNQRIPILRHQARYRPPGFASAVCSRIAEEEQKGGSQIRETKLRPKMGCDLVRPILVFGVMVDL
jgi:hypothetical protein